MWIANAFVASATEIAHLVISKPWIWTVSAGVEFALTWIRSCERDGLDGSTFIGKENAVDSPLLELSASHAT
jgi:hypothetical protein